MTPSMQRTQATQTNELCQPIKSNTDKRIDISTFSPIWSQNCTHKNIDKLQLIFILFREHIFVLWTCVVATDWMAPPCALVEEITWTLAFSGLNTSLWAGRKSVCLYIGNRILSAWTGGRSSCANWNLTYSDMNHLNFPSEGTKNYLK